MEWVRDIYMIVGITYATVIMGGGILYAGLVMANKEVPDWAWRLVPAGFTLAITGAVGCGILAVTKYAVT